MSDAPEKSLGTRAAHGMLWAFGSYAGGRLLVLATTAVLARLLTPEDFGLVALALSFITLLEGLSTLGLGQALVIERDDSLEERAQTAFVWSTAFGLVASIVVAALSPLIARFFDEPELVGIASVLGANFFIRSVGITHYSLAQRHMNFRARTIAEFADVLARGGGGIALAIAGFGAWSLVIGYLLGSLALTLTIWRLEPWRPRRHLGRAHLGSMLRFGGTLSAVDITAAVGNTIDNLFIGRVLGPTALGFYRIAFLVPSLTVVNVSFVAQKVLFPAFARYDPEQLSRVFLITIRYLWLFALPTALTLAVLAEPIILVAFGDQWRGAIEPLQVLAIYGFSLASSFAAGTVYKSTGRAGVVLALVSARVTILVVALLLFVDEGIVAVAACQAGAVTLVESIGIVMASRLLAVPLRAIWRQVWPCVGGALVMAVPLLLAGRFIADPVPELLVGGAAGALVYLGTLHVLAPDAIQYIWAKLAPGRSADEATVAPHVPAS